MKEIKEVRNRRTKEGDEGAAGKLRRKSEILLQILN